MQILEAGSFRGDRAWAALDLAHLPDATVRLHWTDEPYIWHVNDETEVFVVLHGAVAMHFRGDDGQEHVERLTPGRICVVSAGDEHVAVPEDEARILVIERAGSV